MLAFRVEIDGHPPLVAGVQDWKILGLHVDAARGEAYGREGDDLSFSAGGLTTKDAEGISHHFRWPRIPLVIGSTVKITLVETDSPDAVANRFRSDKEVQDNPFTKEEFRDMRRQEYLALKKEFEDEQDA